MKAKASPSTVFNRHMVKGGFGNFRSCGEPKLNRVARRVISTCKNLPTMRRCWLMVKGYENIPKIAPSLLKISAKVDPSWMVRWIENPHKFRPRTRMPNFGLREADAIAIASYIWSQSKEEGDKWTQAHSLPAGFREGDA